MAEEVKNLFGGFNAIVNELAPSSFKKEEDDLPEVTPDEIKKVMGSLDKEDQDDDSSKQVPATENKKEPTISQEVDDNKSDEEDKKETKLEKKSKNDSDEEPESDNKDELDLEEVELVEAFSDLFAEELGWEYEEDEKPSTMKDLVKYMQDIITEASQPSYANDTVRELDEFVKQGGKVSDFYKISYPSNIDVENIDLTKVENQKAVIRENLRNRGYSEQRIDKHIARYEEQDILEEEAVDSKAEVEEFRDKAKKELLESQKNRQEAEIREQLNFVQNVEKIVKNVDNIRGISISEKEKKELLEYIFKPERDGSTKYQKDYMDSLENLVESAYFTKNRNKIIKEIQKKATSDAVKNLKLKLKAQGKSTKNTHSDIEEQDGGKVAQLWEIASKELRSF